jgi:NADH-quinone oxidoreductase subunit C/D
LGDQVITAPQNKNLAEIYPESIIADSRTGYQGYIVKPENLREFALKLRDEQGYDYLSALTGVDYLPEAKFEVVYHFFKSSGGKGVVLKTQVPRDQAEVPSLVPIYPGAEFQEREAWDLLGIRFSGHPDLRRLFLWEGFSGHPLRKDWHEPYYEEESKPFKSRYPEGHVQGIEELNPYKDNLQFPVNFDPAQWIPEGDEAVYKLLRKSQEQISSELKTDQMIINLGPQHPSTHGVFRMAALLDGETVVDVKPIVGYLHRSQEKIGERNTFLQNMPYTDRLDYVSSMSNNFGYALAVEKLMNIQPPERCEYIRVIMAELTRIQSHLIGVGFLLNDLGAFFTPALYGLEERELIIDIFEAVTGSRMMCNYFRFGGVARDLTDECLEQIKKLVLDRLPRKIDDIDRYLTDNEIIKNRCRGVGVLTAEDAVRLSSAGHMLRASGIPYDVRRADPYSIYERFDFEIPTCNHGDVYDRYLIKIREMRQSLRILQQAVKGIPNGPIQTGKSTYQVKVPPGEAYGRVEGPKGELGFYIVSNGKPNPWRYHIRSTSLINLTSLSQMVRGSKIADAVLILGSIDIVMGEVDR